MSVSELFSNDFKSEIQTSGRKLFSLEKVSLTGTSDTAIQAYIKASPSFKVILKSEDIESSSFTADCSCPQAKKAHFCKHIWATLLMVEKKFPDFLSSKNRIKKPDEPLNLVSSPAKNFRAESQARASEYRKDQYQKQKSRAKELKQKLKGNKIQSESASFPEDVEESLKYFDENGFPMREEATKDSLGEAKRKLSRIFHPDKGGSHDESIELNRHCEVIQKYFGF